MTYLPTLRSSAEAATTKGPWGWIAGQDGKPFLSPLQAYLDIEVEETDASFIARWDPSTALLCCNALEAAEKARATLLPLLLHGDEAHKEWLREEVGKVFRDQDAALSALRRHVEEGPR